MFYLFHGSNYQQYWSTITEVVCKVMCSWWWAKEPPETCRASVKINKFKKHCILLVVIWNFYIMFVLPVILLGAFAKLRKATISFAMSCAARLPALYSAWNKSATSGQIFIKFYISTFFENMPKKDLQLDLKSDKNNDGTLREDKYTILIISRPVLLRMRNISDRIYRENQNTQFIFHNFFPKVVPFMR
jgi:hypothetical protein